MFYLKEMAIALKQSGFYSMFVKPKCNCIRDVFDFRKNWKQRAIYFLFFQIEHLVDSRHGTSILRAFEPIGDLPIRWHNQELMSFKLDKGLLFGII